MEPFCTLFATSFFHYTLCRNMQHISKLLVIAVPPMECPPSSSLELRFRSRFKDQTLIICQCSIMIGISTYVKFSPDFQQNSFLSSSLPTAHGHFCWKNICSALLASRDCISESNQESRSQANYLKSRVLIQRIGCRGNTRSERERGGEPPQKVPPALGCKAKGNTR